MKVWTDGDLKAHLVECPEALELHRFDTVEPILTICGCGEASRHTPFAVALAEVERDCPKVAL